MRQLITVTALLSLATPALAGSAPGFVSAWETYTRAFARAGTASNPHQVVEDIDPFPSFFGSANSTAFAQRLDGSVPVDLADADASLTVSGAGGAWTLDSILAADGFGFESEANARAEFSFSATFGLAQGENFVYAGSVMEMSTTDEPGIGQVTARIYRNDMLLNTFSYEEFDGPFQHMVEEATGAEYRLEFFGEARGGGSGAGGGSIPSLNMTLTTHIEIAIIPAPVSAAPLAIGGLLVARRRRA